MASENNIRPAEEFYDELGEAYERMINWKERLRRESPFFRNLLRDSAAKSVLDCACGSGQHAVEFACWGYEVWACDISASLLQLAEQNAAKARAPVKFFKAGLTEVRARLPRGRTFDAAVCLGNSLPHLATQRELDRALKSMKRSLTPGGVFIAQIRNYEKILKQNLRFMPPTSGCVKGEECIFFRMLDILGPRRVDFHIIRFRRRAGKWDYEVQTTRLRPIVKKSLEAALRRAGFSTIHYYGDYSFSPFEKLASTDLIVVAR